ncbi:hypothetical protein DPM19_05480 [Actinomadura craniellae]|uniref:Uncharacterized protein n=1 Tax=Actinomadura craniellae TaxID=2231787 RepID=A0A365HB75_9ACTN|nr:hypothetical protein [Actinomadura craniellae]RAY16335.1 hypothetical protein DPM19_05480 [Actinomadura craniellae]
MTNADVDFVVLTALGVEHDAVRARLGETHPHVDPYGTRYLLGKAQGVPGRVALVLVGEGNLAAAVLAARAIEEFGPETLMMVGVAGGLKDEAALGDVVVGTRVYAYQGGREETAGFRPRPRVWPVSHALEQTAREVASEGRWHEPGDDAPAVHFKPIVSGEVVLDSRASPLAALIESHYGDALAIDMESAGVAEAAHRKDFHRMVAVRGISDATDGAKRQMDEKGWQPRAAANAAAFALALAARLKGASPDPPAECPYRGLAAFREEDAEIFFGRARLADELTELVSRTRFVAVAGRSGCGKSSLVSAGLLPRLRGQGWALATFRPMPGVPAATVLAGGLLPLLRPELDGVEAIPERAIVADAIAGGRLPELVGEVLAETGARRLLLSADQFEEYVAHSEAAAGDLCGFLARLATGGVPVHVLLTLRTETLDIAVNRLELGEVTRNSVFLVSPMSAAELREAIESPLEPTGLSFEPGLAERVLEGAEGAPAALSLTQFALTRLWEQRESGRLTHAAYGGFGGVEGAVAHYAETVWTGELDDTERLRARRLLVQLVRPVTGAEHGTGEVPGTAGPVDDVVLRTARESELGPELARTARRLAETRLVVTGSDGGEVTYDLAHAALARHWRRLGDWLEEERDFRSWQEDLRESLRRSEQLRGPRLAQAVRWLREHPDDITAAERAFVETSRRGHRRRTTAWRGGLAAIVVLLVLVSAFAVVLRQQTAETERQLRLNAAHLLRVQALDRLGAPDAAALRTVAAYRASDDPRTQAHLAAEYLRHQSTGRLFDAAVGDVHQLEMSADGRVVAVRGATGTAVARPDLPGRPPARLGPAQVIALSPDGRLLAQVTAGGRVEVRETDRPSQGATVLHESEQSTGTATNLRFDAQGRRLLVTLPREGLRIWDTGRRAAIPAPPGSAPLVARGGQAWFGPDGDTIVVRGEDELVLWRLSTGKATRLPARGHVAATVSEDGRTAVACGTRTFSAWNLSPGAAPAPRRVTTARCPMLLGPGHDHIDPTGRFMLTGLAPEGGDDHPRRRATLVDLETGHTAHPVLVSGGVGDPGSDTQLARTSGGLRLAAATGSGVAVIDLPPAAFQQVNELAGNSADPHDPVLSEDLQLMATRPILPHGDIRLWDVATGREIGRRATTGTRVPLGFSRDGRSFLVRDSPFQHLDVLDVPSLRPKGRLPLPVARPDALPAPGAAERFSGPCVAHTDRPDTVAIVYGGFAGRFDLRRGVPAGPPLRLWGDEEDLTRLADTERCATRPGGDEIAFDTAQGVELWDLPGGRRQATLRTTAPGQVADLRFASGGRFLAILHRNGTLETWDLAGHRPSASPLRVLPPAATTREIVAFPGPDRIVVRTLDRLQIWDLRRRAAVADLNLAVADARVSADGGSLLLWGLSGLSRLPLAPGAWAAHLCRAVNRDFTAAERRTLPPGTPTTRVCPTP